MPPLSSMNVPFCVNLVMTSGYNTTDALAILPHFMPSPEQANVHLLVRNLHPHIRSSNYDRIRCNLFHRRLSFSVQTIHAMLEILPAAMYLSPNTSKILPP